MSLARESRVPIRTESSDIELRKGKWTVEEENYANKIITLFNQGMLPVVAGTTLRTYLSDKLRCDPMRITKKYAGASCIGKQVFQLCDNYYECFQENERELQRLENLFLIRINGKGGGGMSGKRGGGAGEAPQPHQSIYETSNLDASSAPTNLAPNHAAAKRPYKTNRRGSGSKIDKEMGGGGGFGMLGGSPRLVNHRHSAEQKPGFSPHYDSYRSGSDEYDDHSADDDYYEQGDESGFEGAGRSSGGSRTGLGARPSGGGDEDDYGYAYDPDGDAESAQHHAQQQRALRQYQAYEELIRTQHAQQQTQQQQPLQGGAAGGFYNSLQAGGRRVLSAPNLTELNLSSWKATDYRPLPADSLKEMFSLPMHDHHHASLGQHGGAHHAAYGGGGFEFGAGAGSLLPEHVYSAMGNESGRYASNGHSRGAAGAMGSSAAVMAARARATKLALQHHQQEQQLRSAYPYPYPHAHSGSGAGGREGRAVDDAAGLLGGNNKLRMKRSHSAMALMDFEKLAGDDTAAGDFFLQFLNKVSDTSNNNTPRRAVKPDPLAPSADDAAGAGASAGPASSTGVAELVMEAEEEQEAAGDKASLSSTHAFVPTVSAEAVSELVEVSVEVEAVNPELLQQKEKELAESAMDLS